MSANLGFTGTQHGMTGPQMRRVEEYVSTHRPRWLRHGDCVGSDSQMHEIVRRICPLAKITVYPPIDDRKRAFCPGDEVREPKEYLDRDDDIARECDELLATPREMEEARRSGTWATIRRARKYRKRVVIVYPDGSLRVEQPMTSVV